MSWFSLTVLPCFINIDILTSVVVKDLRLKDKESSFKDKDLMSKHEGLMSKDKDEGLKIGPRGRGLSSRKTTLRVRQCGEIDMNLNLTGTQWQISHTFVTQSLQDDGA